MPFSTDRDLLAHAPDIFIDVPLLSQQRLHVTDAQITGITLTSADADFAAANVAGGDVLIARQQTLEVISRADANTLTVSLPRASLDDPPIAPGDGADLEVRCRTFAPQASIVRGVLLRMLHIDPDDTDADVTDDAIVSLSTMAQLEVLGTLERIYSAAHALAGDNTNLRQRYEHFRALFNQACRGAIVKLDLDGDGIADAQRRLGIVLLHRQ